MFGDLLLMPSAASHGSNVNCDLCNRVSAGRPRRFSVRTQRADKADRCGDDYEAKCAGNCGQQRDAIASEWLPDFGGSPL